MRSTVDAVWLGLPRWNIIFFALSSVILALALAIGISWRLGALTMILFALIGMALLLTYVVEQYCFPLFEFAAITILTWLQNRDSRLARSLHFRLGDFGADLPLVALLAVVVMGGVWLFIGMLEDVVSSDPLVVVDLWVFRILQALRSPTGDAILVVITELGDRTVIAAVVVLMSIGFLICKRWQTALYLILVTFGSTVFVFGMKSGLHRPRPLALYDGASDFSFPSGHATSSIVVYGFLAIVLARFAAPMLRRALIRATLSLILLIAFSRLYLGAHWLSDVGAGLSFGAGWIAALAILYFQRNRQPLPSHILVGLLMATLLIAGAWHIGHSFSIDMGRYAPS